MPSAALRAIRQRVTIEWRQRTEEQAKALLLRTARAGHARIMAEQARRAGVIPEWTAYANQEGNSNLDSVRLPGPIVFRYRYLREIVIHAINRLEFWSPVDSGLYKKSHTLYVNGIASPLDTPIKPGDEVYIANPVPYARRLEVGKTQTGRNFLVSVPNRIYERVAKQDLIPRYRNAAGISVIYVQLPDAWTIKGRLPSHYPIGGGASPAPPGAKLRRRRQNIGEKVRAPAILIQGHT